MKRCSQPGCRNKRSSNKLCPKHAMKAWRAANPEKAAYSILRNNARRRGKTFKLTFEEFLEYNAKTRYTELKGIGADDQTIDRVRNEIGYQADNIQPLSLSANAAKGWKPINDNIEF